MMHLFVRCSFTVRGIHLIIESVALRERWASYASKKSSFAGAYSIILIVTAGTDVHKSRQFCIQMEDTFIVRQENLLLLKTFVGFVFITPSSVKILE